MPSSTDLLADRYRVLRHLGSGGMATVDLAMDETLQREVAVKRVHAPSGGDTERRLKREARLGATLAHPSLVTVYDSFVDGDTLIIVMEYVAGETLADRLKQAPLAMDEVLRIVEPVASALDHAHEKGVVHRDVKPANILIGTGGTVKLADLGIAVADDVSRITHADGLLGSVAYMAPEQFRPGRVGPAADVYALASVAFEALTGGRARSAGTPLDHAREAEHPPPDAHEIRPAIPAAVAAVLRAGMAVDPGERPATAGEFATALREAAGAARPPAPAAVPETPAPPRGTGRFSTAATPGRRPERAPAPPRRRSLAPLLALLALGAVFVIAAVLLLSGADGDGDPGGSAAAPEASPEGQAQQAPAEASPEAEEETAAPAGEQDAAPAADASTPDGAVRAFYEAAARDDFAAAYALAGPRMRAAFGNSERGLENTLGSLESIRFERLEVAERDGSGATVRVATVARHTNRTDRCSGTLRAVGDDDSGYRVDPHGIRCRQG